MPAWPASLPQFSSEGYSEKDGDNVLRSPPDVGPPLTRRRSTAAPRTITGNIEVDDTQKVALHDFHKLTCLEGSISFTKNDIHGVQRTYKFLAPPEFQYVAFDWWRAVLSLEELL